MDTKPLLLSVKPVEPDAELRWVEGVRAGDPSAFEAMFRAYYARLCRFAVRLVGNPADTEEIVEEIFSQIWENRAAWRPGGTLRSYLYRAARNGAINCLKHRRVVQRWAESQLNDPGIRQYSLDEEVQQHELRAAIEQAVELLPPSCRLAFVLHRQDGLSYREVADVLEISVKTVENNLGRAFRILRRILVPYLPLLACLQMIPLNFP